MGAAKGVDAAGWWVFIALAVLLMCKAKSDTIHVQGSIFCLSDHRNKATPIHGARAKIECKSSDVGETRIIISSPTNIKGFYSATSSTRRGSSKLRNCKAFLHSSSMPDCSSPTNINGGQTGADLLPFSSSRHSRDKHYSVKPFLYSN